MLSYGMKCHIMIIYLTLLRVSPLYFQFRPSGFPMRLGPYMSVNFSIWPKLLQEKARFRSVLLYAMFRDFLLTPQHTVLRR